MRIVINAMSRDLREGHGRYLINARVVKDVMEK